MLTSPFRRALAPMLLISVALLGWAASAPAQESGPAAIVRKVTSATDRMEMTVNTSRVLTLDKRIPQAQVNNPEVLVLTPLSPNQVQVFAKAPGVTQVNLWDEDERIYTIDVIVLGDARELDLLLKTQFPNSSLKVIPVSAGVLISGYVDQPNHVSRVVQIAEEYYPRVINNMSVGGVQQVLLHIKVMEVSRTKLRTFGFDFSILTTDGFLVSAASGALSSVASAAGGRPSFSAQSAPSSTLAFGVMGDSSAFFGVLDAMRQNNLVKILSEPTLVTVSGRPALFQVGGEFPVLVPQGLGATGIEFRPYGTQLDFVPIVLGNGRIRLEVRPRVSEIDYSRVVTVGSTTTPGLRVRQVDTGVEMMGGQTLAIAGLLETRVEAETHGLPWVSEVPYVGALFRRTKERQNEVELLVLVTPELVEAMDPCQVPACGPGTNTASPSDWELVMKGYLEVPKCCQQCNGSGCPSCQQTMPMPAGNGAPQPAAPEDGLILPPGTAPSSASPSDGAGMKRPEPVRSAQTPRPAVRPRINAVSAAVHRQAAPPAGPALTPPANRDTLNPQGASDPEFLGPVGYDRLP